MTSWLCKMLSDRRAVTSLEYAFIAAIFVGVVAASFAPLGHSLNAKVLTIAVHMT